MNPDRQSILENATFDDRGLIPAIVQDDFTREVLAVAYMNAESLRLTLESNQTWFFSRSRQRLWHKGETSGNTQVVVDVRLDCDSDAILVRVRPNGPACHTGSFSCFGVEPGDAHVLDALYALLLERRAKRPEGSYSTYLFNSGLDKILKKIGEESTETVVAAKNDDPTRVVEEASDLLYHLLVLLVEKGIPLGAIRAELTKRHSARSGQHDR